MCFDLDKILQNLIGGIIPDTKEIYNLIEFTIPLFINSPNVLKISSPCILVGDLHGQFYDFLILLKKANFFENPRNIIFLGDIVDRGYYSIETLCLVLVLKLKFPNMVNLIRGNHESKQITQVYGFYDELKHRIDSPFEKNRFSGKINLQNEKIYENDIIDRFQENTNIEKTYKANLSDGTALWRRFIDLFDVLPISALIDGTHFCAHGGIPRDCPSLSQINSILRFGEVPFSGEVCDLLWSDPYEHLLTKLWEPNSRGAGVGFSKNLLDKFLYKNGLEKMYRSHQLVMEGFKRHFEHGKLITIWSAPNYCYRCGNLASVGEFKNGKDEFLIFGAAGNHERNEPEIHSRISLLEES